MLIKKKRLQLEARALLKLIAIILVLDIPLYFFMKDSDSLGFLISILCFPAQIIFIIVYQRALSLKISSLKNKDRVIEFVRENIDQERYMLCETQEIIIRYETNSNVVDWFLSQKNEISIKINGNDLEIIGSPLFINKIESKIKDFKE